MFCVVLLVGKYTEVLGHIIFYYLNNANVCAKSSLMGTHYLFFISLFTGPNLMSRSNEDIKKENNSQRVYQVSFTLTF